MPGLRYYMTLDLGEAFGEDWEREFGWQNGSLSRTSTRTSVKGKGKAGHEEETIAGPPYGGWLPFSQSTTTLRSEIEENPFKDPVGDGDGFNEDDGGLSDGTEYLSTKQRRAWRVLQTMKQDEEWNGTKYKLLERYIRLSFPFPFPFPDPSLTVSPAETAITLRTSSSTALRVAKLPAG
jgi:hypothetical protein